MDIVGGGEFSVKMSGLSLEKLDHRCNLFSKRDSRLCLYHCIIYVLNFKMSFKSGNTMTFS